MTALRNLRKIMSGTYRIYYDCGTTNTRAYLIKDGRIFQSVREAVGIKDFVHEKDKKRLAEKLHEIFEILLAKEKIDEKSVPEIWLSGMISSPDGLAEVEHVSTPAGIEKLKDSVFRYFEPGFFRRELKIVPGVKTIKQKERVAPEKAHDVNMMRGEETEIFGIIRENPGLKNGVHAVLLPGSHTQAVLLKDGVIIDISSNITGELFSAISKDTILGASISGTDEWKINKSMVKLGAGEVHRAGFNRALYILRIQDLFTGSTLNDRRSYLEGVLNIGVMDAVSLMAEKNCPGDAAVALAVAGDEIQKDVFSALAEMKNYGRFKISDIVKNGNVPYSVSGILSFFD